MPPLTHELADEFVNRVEAIPDDATPAWGSLNKATLVGHLIWAFQSSMEPESQPGKGGNWVMRKLVGPMLMYGIIPFPKNVKFPGKDGQPINVITEGDINDLRDTLKDFITQCEAGTLQTASHPVFADLGPQRWSLFHVQHFKHHLKQFNA